MGATTSSLQPCRADERGSGRSARSALGLEDHGHYVIEPPPDALLMRSHEFGAMGGPKPKTTFLWKAGPYLQQEQEEAFGVTGRPSVLSHLKSLFELDIQELEEFGPSKTEASGQMHPPRRFRSGAVYRGHWQGNARHGFGIQHWPDGTRYEGEWANNAAEGRGRITFADGDVYTGEWRASMFHGLGVYTGQDGSTYLGTWENDQREGFGLEVRSRGMTCMEFAGCFRGGQKEGPGVGTWPDGGQYCGDWAGGQISGKGVHRNAKGGEFQGEWLKAARHGRGCHTWPDGRSYMGTYHANEEVDLGFYFYPSGKCKAGQWREGQFCEVALAGETPSSSPRARQQTPRQHKRVRKSVSWGTVAERAYVA
mmetsp:Transcript_91764/g.259796  ORF Transcript_91764/g.259796 Transcript_91764/m.259796 type:complete len:367 (+) Transcript_91764:57-1157(+)